MKLLNMWSIHDFGKGMLLSAMYTLTHFPKLHAIGHHQIYNCSTSCIYLYRVYSLYREVGCVKLLTTVRAEVSFFLEGCKFCLNIRLDDMPLHISNDFVGHECVLYDEFHCFSLFDFFLNEENSHVRILRNFA